MTGFRNLMTIYGLILLLWAALIAFASVGEAATVVLSCGSVGRELELCREAASQWAKETGNRVELVTAPADSGARLEQYQLLLAAGASDIDVFLIDTTWPGILSDFLLDLRPWVPSGVVQRHFPDFVANNTVQGKLLAMPWFIDAGLLYYRKDLLEKHGEKAPETWAELTRIAEKIQEAERRAGSRKFWGYVFQARAYEGLTCNALEWIHNFGGGSIVDSSGKITLSNPRAVAALELVSSWVGRIAPRGVLDFMEEETRGAFQSGNALFMRNWPYAWKLVNSAGSQVRGKVGVSPLPSGSRGGERAGTLGGWSLAVSRFSKAPKEAASLVRYLTDSREQKRRALISGLNPTLPELYRDPDLLRENPFLSQMLAVFRNTVARPSKVVGPRYTQVSTEFWESVHTILSREERAPVAVAQLNRELVRIGRGGEW